MIEPQNTVFPVPAEPVPVLDVESDGAGFGAMLAESLGLVSPSDLSVVQQLRSGHHQQNEAQDGDILGDADQAIGEVVDAVSSQPMPTPVLSAIPTSIPQSPEPTPKADPAPVAKGATKIKRISPSMSIP